MRHIITLFARSLVLTALVVASQCVCAQKWNAWVAVQALDSTINAHQGQARMLRELAEDICKKGSHQPNVVTGVARAFLHYNYDERLTEIGMDYLNEVLAKHPDYAPAYVLMGNLYISDEFSASKTKGYIDCIGYRVKNEEGKSLEDSAAYWYQRAIDVEPSNPIGYENDAALMAIKEIAKAERDVSKVEEVMQKCAANVPNYSFEWGMIRCLEATGLYSFTLNYYNKLDITTLSEEQLEDYANEAHRQRNWEKLAEIIDYALENHPENFIYTRWGVEANLELGKNCLNFAENAEDSLNAETKLNKVEMFWKKLQQMDDINLVESDYTQVGQALRLLGRLNESADIYLHLLNVDSLHNNHKTYLATLAVIYRDLKKWDEAENIHRRLISMAVTDEEKIQRYYNYGYMYYQKGRQATTDEDKRESYVAGNEVLKEASLTLPVKNISYYGDIRTIRLLMCWKPFAYYYETEPINQFKTSYGKAYAEQIIEVANDEYISENDYRDIAYAAHYLGNYFLEQHDLEKSKEYFELVLKYGEGYRIYKEAQDALKSLNPSRPRRGRR